MALAKSTSDSKETVVASIYILVSVDYLLCSMRTSLSYPKWLKIRNIEATTVSFLSEVDFASAIMGKTVTVHA